MMILYYTIIVFLYIRHMHLKYCMYDDKIRIWGPTYVDFLRNGLDIDNNYLTKIQYKYK